MNLTPPPGIPTWQSESTEAIKARFSSALVPDIDVIKVAEDQRLAPGLVRRHIFDFQDYKIRLVASTDRDGSLRLVHLSFSSWPDTLVPDINAFTRLARQIAAELVGDRTEVHHFYTQRAFHLFYRP